MLGVYFSGTGNTKHCVETFVELCEKGCAAVSIEDEDVLAQIAANDTLVLGYPVYFSNIPKIVRGFIAENGACFKDKQVFIIATMGLFSGDGCGCAARPLEKLGAKILGGLHLKMPDCIGDEKALKRTPNDNRALIINAQKKIAGAVQQLKAGNPPKEGLGVLYRLAGIFGQRLWTLLYMRRAAAYKIKPRLDTQKCTGCGLCARLCPMKNIIMEANRAAFMNRCTLCYRCFARCPQKALTILGKRVHEQCLFEKYHYE